MFVLGIVLFLAVLFVVLSVWQKHAESAERDRVLSELRDANDRGTRKPLAQFPHIQPTLCIGCGSCVAACPEDGVLGLVNGIAHVINAARCVGHAKCQDACPVNAITVGLGNIAERSDIPVLTAEMETSLPNVFIAGELGGLALIRHAVDQGTRVIDVITKRVRSVRPSSAPEAHDVVIVGAGPAGLAATFRAVENKLRYVTLSLNDVGGTVRKYPRQKLTLVQTVALPLHGRIDGREYPKEELITLWEKLIHTFHVSIRTGAALLGLRRDGELWAVETSIGLFQGRHVVLALGRRGVPRKLGVPGEEAEKVLYQLMDASTYNGQHALVVGGGDSAVEAAMALANQHGNTVTLSYRKETFFRLKARNEQRIADYIAKKRIRVLFSSEVVAIEPDKVALMVHAGGDRRIEIPNQVVFVFAGGDPPFALLQKIGIRFGGASSAAGKRAVA